MARQLPSGDALSMEVASVTDRYIEEAYDKALEDVAYEYKVSPSEIQDLIDQAEAEQESDNGA